MRIGTARLPFLIFCMLHGTLSVSAILVNIRCIVELQPFRFVMFYGQLYIKVAIKVQFQALQLHPSICGK